MVGPLYDGSYCFGSMLGPPDFRSSSICIDQLSEPMGELQTFRASLFWSS